MIGTEKFSFTGANGQKLDGRLEKPLYVKPRGAAIFAHCFTCTKQIRAATQIATTLAGRGIAVLRFDFTGLGGSEGDFANAGFASNMDDLVAAAEALEGAGMPTVLLVGHSLGGAAVIGAAERIPTAKAVATIGAPFDTTHVYHNFGDSIEAIERDGKAKVQIVGREFTISRDFLEQGREQPQAERLAKLGKALLIMHAPTDDVVGIDSATDIFSAAKHPKSFVSLDGADHLLSDPAHAAYAANVIAAWAQPHLNETVKPEGEFAGTVEVSTAGGKFAQWVRTPSHAFIADEPVSYGGRNDGPTPYDLLLGALGSCTAMTMQMYAERKGIALEGVRIDLEHSRDHHTDCLECEEGSEPIQVIDRAIEITGDLTDEQRAKLMEIADKCPVHRTIEGDLHIHSTLVE